MPFRGATPDREYDKFKAVGNETAVRVSIAEDETGGGGVYPAANIVSQFSEVSAIASGVETTLLTYTVPVGKTLYLDLVHCSGENIADYRVYKDASRIARARSYFGGPLNVTFEFGEAGAPLLAGEAVVVKVLHSRPLAADFEARISGRLA